MLVAWNHLLPHIWAFFLFSIIKKTLLFHLFSRFLSCSCPYPSIRRGRDRMVVGFTTTCAISPYRHWSCEFKSRLWCGVLDATLCDKVCHLLSTGRCFLRILQFPPQALEFRTPVFPHLVPPASMVWIFVWKYIFEPFIHILQHFVFILDDTSIFPPLIKLVATI